jgi:signal transduction histidine kinase
MIGTGLKSFLMGLPLSALLKAHHRELVERWTNMVARENTAVGLERAELVDRLPRFIDELVAALHPEALPLPSPASNAVEHGAQRLALGFNVREVVREYGILHRCVIAIAAESGHVPTAREHTVLASVLNDGIAAAVTQYVADRDTELRRAMSEHLGFIAHEVRNPLSSARMAVGLLKRRELAKGGRAVDLLERTLRRTSDVVDNALNHATLSLGVLPRLELVRLGELLREVVFDAGAEAEVKNIAIVIDAAEELTLEADRRLLHSAIANLLQNALKFTRPGTTIHVRGGRFDTQVAIEIEDACGGLPPGKAEDLFKPLVRRGENMTGYGLGLAIAQQAAQAHGGTLRARDLPGVGCVFRIELPAGTATTSSPR